MAVPKLGADVGFVSVSFSWSHLLGLHLYLMSMLARAVVNAPLGFVANSAIGFAGRSWIVVAAHFMDTVHVAHNWKSG
jgi:hypothetical protein